MIIKHLIQLSNSGKGTLYHCVSFNFARVVKQTNVVLKDFTDIDPDKRQQVTITNGRSWRAAELRIKSTQDLHKLWFVCVKEKNLLMADRIIQNKISQKDNTKPRLDKVKQTMKRILTVVNERQKIRREFRQKLQQEYIQQKRKQLLEQVAQKPQSLPQITHEMMRQKYHELRRGIDNTQYLQKLWAKKQQYQARIQRKNERVANQKEGETFTSFWQKQKKMDEIPMQDQILRAHIKNWRMLNLKQRKIVLGFLNARRAKDAKSAFLKELKILGQKIAHQQASTRIMNN